MRTKTKLLIIAAALITSLCGCEGSNKQILDLTLKFDHAIINLPDGRIIEGTIESWRDYSDGDQIQVNVDGVTYLVHSSNVVLIKE